MYATEARIDKAVQHHTMAFVHQRDRYLSVRRYTSRMRALVESITGEQIAPMQS
jgi:hypothetical protein